MCFLHGLDDRKVSVIILLMKRINVVTCIKVEIVQLFPEILQELS